MNYISTLPNGYFGNAAQSWISINVEKIRTYLESKGIECQIISILDLEQLELSFEDTVFYCSFDNVDVANYIRDLLYFYNKKTNLVPNFDMLMCFENKGAQEIYKKHNNILGLRGSYQFELSEAKFSYPKVFKINTGAASSGVYLLKNHNDLKIVRKKFFKVSLKRTLIKLIRRFKLSPEEYRIYSYRYDKYTPYVLQDFVSDLDRDYKILIFGEKYFVLTRYVRKNDFRASGSGKFEFLEVNENLLFFAKEIFLKLRVPNASLDIAEKEGQYYLIEFQAVNFGPYTVYQSPFYYIQDNLTNRWTIYNERSDLEQCFAESFEWYLNNV